MRSMVLRRTFFKEVLQLPEMEQDFDMAEKQLIIGYLNQFEQEISDQAAVAEVLARRDQQARPQSPVADRASPSPAGVEPIAKYDLSTHTTTTQRPALATASPVTGATTATVGPASGTPDTKPAARARSARVTSSAGKKVRWDWADWLGPDAEDATVTGGSGAPLSELTSQAGNRALFEETSQARGKTRPDTTTADHAIQFQLDDVVDSVVQIERYCLGLPRLAACVNS